MLNTKDILETIRMITDENLDVRTVTMGISLLDCVDEDPDRCCEKIYNKITTKAARLVQHSHRHAPSLVLVDAVLRGGAGMLWQSTLMLYDDEGKPTPQMKEIYHMEE